VNTIKVITVNVPETYVAAIASLVGEGTNFPSRSELVRVAVREFLKKFNSSSAPVSVVTPEELLPNLVHVPMGVKNGRMLYKTYKKVKR